MNFVSMDMCVMWALVTWSQPPIQLILNYNPRGNLPSISHPCNCISCGNIFRKYLELFISYLKYVVLLKNSNTIWIIKYLIKFSILQKNYVTELLIYVSSTDVLIHDKMEYKRKFNQISKLFATYRRCQILSPLYYF